MQGEKRKKGKNYLIYIIFYFLLIFNIKTINYSYIYIEKFIAKLVVNVFINESKLLPKSLLSFPLKH
ncbi:hypothetical protein EKA14_27605 [Bacillus mycoides]|nr:hypothetical protein EKA14_27605 [Bacillus mycoides]